MGLRKSILAASLAALFTTATANAALHWSDGFDYADGELTVYDGTGADVSGGVWTPRGGTGFPTAVIVDSGEAILRQGNPASEDVSRSVPALAAGQTLYASFTFSVEDLRGGTESFDADQSYPFHLDFRSRVHLLDGTDANSFTLGLAGTSGAPDGIWGSDLAFDTYHQVIVSYEFDTGISEMWVNPVNMASASVTSASPPGGGLDTVDLRQDFINDGNGGDHGVVSVDAAAAGSDFGSVLPEPASLALLALGGVTVLRRRR
ncbi:MAG: hypothetical protein DHS20C16_35100 [Phycisphaerae bacterium]|nr:MAG: hypothetical protein DHS20C16_35100 [Phycisphaerae bacterium]